MIQTLKNTMTVVIESLINRFEEDQLKKEELHREMGPSQSNSQFMDNCSDSDSSFNQVGDAAHIIQTQSMIMRYLICCFMMSHSEVLYPGSKL